MSHLSRVNRRRAWVLFTLIWLAGCAFWYLAPINISRAEAAEHKRKLDAESRTRLFEACLTKNNLTWSALYEAHRAECFVQASEECKGGGRWCAVEYWQDFCIRAKAVPCRDIGALIEGDGSPPVYAGLSYTNDKMLKHLIYYWNSGYSSVAREGLGVTFGPPLLLMLLPLVTRRLWSWVTTAT